MITHIYRFSLFVLCITIVSCSPTDDTLGTDDSDLDLTLREQLIASSSTGDIDYFKLPDSDDYDALPQDANNPITSAKVELGKHLFHETGMATRAGKAFGMGTYSCASCHIASAGFRSGNAQGIADGGVGFGINGENRQKSFIYQDTEVDVQPVRAPTILNVAYQTNLLWNGSFGANGMNTGMQTTWQQDAATLVNDLGFDGVETQAIQGLIAHRLHLEDDLMLDSEYRAYFDAAFPELAPDERYSQHSVAMAMAAYERTVLSNEAPFQRYLRNEFGAMTPAEKRGAILFFGKAGCNDCHTGPALNSMEFFAIGMGDLTGQGINVAPDHKAHLGRGGFSSVAEEMYRFKVPTLYNLSDAQFYGHGSTLRTIAEVIDYKNDAVPENPNVPAAALAAEFVPLQLTAAERADLVAFLTTGLRDDRLERYLPTSLPSGNCFPNNDDQSRFELGCGQ